MVLRLAHKIPFILVFISILLYFQNSVYAQDECTFKAQEIQIDACRMDSVFQSISKSTKNNPQKFVAIVDSLTENNFEKVYLYYTFIGANFTYDLRKAKNIEKNGVKRILSPKELMKSKKGVCGDFAYLMKNFCDSSGITARVIMGTAKNKKHPLFLKNNKLNHAWNAIKIDESWYLMDVTWGIKNYTDKRYNQKQVSYIHLFQEPEQFALYHYPADPNWQLLNQPKEWKSFKWDTKNKQKEQYDFTDTLNIRLSLKYEDQLFKSALSAYYNDPKSKNLVYRLLYLPINDNLDVKKQKISVEELIIVKNFYQNILSHYLSQNTKKSDRIANHFKREVAKYDKLISKKSQKIS